MDLGNVQEILCERISLFAGQPRKYFNKQRMEELASSIKAIGQKTPGKVMLLPNGGGRYAYELIDGERRWRVCKELGIPFKAWVVDYIEDTKAQYLDSVVANSPKEELSELETLDSIIKIKGDFDLTLEQTAAHFGKSIGWVGQYLSLRKLEPQVLQMMSPELPDNQRLGFSHALLLTSLKPELQIQIASTVTHQGLKIKEVKYLVERHTGGSTRTSDSSPRAEYEKFRNFLQRSMVDLELFLKQPKEYFANMFQYRVPADLEKMSGMVSSAIDNLTAIKKTLDRVKTENAKKAKAS